VCSHVPRTLAGTDGAASLIPHPASREGAPQRLSCIERGESWPQLLPLLELFRVSQLKSAKQLLKMKGWEKL